MRNDNPKSDRNSTGGFTGLTSLSFRSNNRTALVFEVHFSVCCGLLRFAHLCAHHLEVFTCPWPSPTPNPQPSLITNVMDKSGGGARRKEFATRRVSPDSPSSHTTGRMGRSEGVQPPRNSSESQELKGQLAPSPPPKKKAPIFTNFKM